MASRKFLVPILVPGDPTAALEVATKQYVDSRAIPSFASTAARDTAISSPVSGMICITNDTGTIWQYMTSAWYPLAGSGYQGPGQVQGDGGFDAPAIGTTKGYLTPNNANGWLGMTGGLSIVGQGVRTSVAGTYEITWVVTTNGTANTNGYIIMYLELWRGGVIATSRELNISQAGGYNAGTLTKLAGMNANDEFRFGILAASTGQNVTASKNYWSLRRIGA